MLNSGTTTYNCYCFHYNMDSGSGNLNKEENMSFIGNIIWFFLGGFILGLGWIVAGIVWCITIIGIPLGLQCFKIAGVAMCPFGKTVENKGNPLAFLLNILWLCISGIEIAIVHFVAGLLFCVTIIGIPFGKQHFKLARVALMPFGTYAF